MAERVTKSYADKHDEIKAKIKALEEQDEKMTEAENEFYQKAGKYLITRLDADDLKDLKKIWNSKVPDDMKIEKIECDVEMPKIDPVLILKDPTKAQGMVDAYQAAAEAQQSAAGKTISTILHVSVLNDLKYKLIEFGFLSDTRAKKKADKSESTEEETLEDVNLEDVLAQEQAEQQSGATDSSEYVPYM